ncbi:MAG: prenyltransferase/squalene oxidase repeat-containing protein [Gemmataceae bacterium]
MKNTFGIGTIVSCVALALMASHVAHAQTKTQYGPDKTTWNKMVDKAIKYLRSAQDETGGWSTKRSPGVTGIVVTGLLRTGKVSVDDPMITKALKYIESLVNEEKGHIAGNNRVNLHNYVTCINVMALVEANQADKYKAVIGNAVSFLKQLQWDESESKTTKNDFYGGAGYDSKSRPDLSNTQFFLDALKEAGVPKDDPALKKALVFVSRCQNLKSENNDQPWAGIINDGSFIYSAATGGVTKVLKDEKGRPGYGSMTYAGVKSLIYCGVDKSDKRIKKAYNWIKKNYTVEKNPGFGEVNAGWGLYYYYHTMSKALAVMEIDIVVDAKGIKHDWRKDISDSLMKRQQSNGSWVNRGWGRWMESDPNLVTGYSLMALSNCKPKLKK